MKKILITLPIKEEEKEAFFRAIEHRDSYNLSFTEESQLTEDDVRSASAIIGMVPPELLTSADKLEWLQIGWAGAEQYCEKGVLRAEAILTNASGAYGHSVSEHMVALTLALACSLPFYIRKQDAHRWERRRRRVPHASSCEHFRRGS